jgi:hypothetical protein
MPPSWHSLSGTAEISPGSVRRARDHSTGGLKQHACPHIVPAPTSHGPTARRQGLDSTPSPPGSSLGIAGGNPRRTLLGGFIFATLHLAGSKVNVGYPGNRAMAPLAGFGRLVPSHSTFLLLTTDCSKSSVMVSVTIRQRAAISSHVQRIRSRARSAGRGSTPRPYGRRTAHEAASQLSRQRTLRACQSGR